MCPSGRLPEPGLPGCCLQTDQRLPSILYNAASKVLPNNEINSIWYHGEGKTAHISSDSDSTIYINPYTAEVVNISEDHEDFFHFIEEGHFFVWLPEKVGSVVVGWATFIFLILLITGVVLWWPKKWSKTNTNKSFKIKWRAKFKRVNYDLHNVLGFYSLIFALLLAVTGLVMSFAWFSNGVFWLAGERNVSNKRVKPLSDTSYHVQVASLQKIDEAWQMGVTTIGEYNKDQIIIAFPKKASDAISLCVDMYNGTWRYVYLDQHTLKPLPASELKIKDEPFARWLRRSNFGLHVGAFFGLPTKIIFFFVSMVVASLPITGFYIWWGRRKKNKKADSDLTFQNPIKKTLRVT
ncbi:MAG: PepSY domain-containing protein, partial [Pedobacter sp.]